MQISEFFSPISESVEQKMSNAPVDSMWHHIEKNLGSSGFPFMNNIKIAIVGVEETRGAKRDYEAKNGVDYVRQSLYSLKKHGVGVPVADLGNVRLGVTVEDTYAALTEIVISLLQLKIIPVIIGASQDMTVAHYRAYKKIDQIINMVGVDARFDLGMPSDPLDSVSWLGNIVMDQPNHLYNYSNIAHQTYFVGDYAVNMMDNLYFDTCRLGEVNQDATEMEPIIRNADVMTFDLSSIRYSDASATSTPSPNGLTGDMACQIMYYAGMSDKLEGIGIYEYAPSADTNQMTAALIAQMVWYFMEGVSNRKNDFPDSTSSQFTVYNLTLRENNEEMHFLKSNVTGRWWMEIPLSKIKKKLDRHQLVPCSYEDYQKACNNEIPERWWQALKKLS
ncbi:MAG TPA: formimidoylglutamase [Bacteroidia bacterium]|nr:formimidoylglutamase [Bacteroidia bacterium]HOM90303.1 formimidoylglutamase [Bacteroidia bacterium]